MDDEAINEFTSKILSCRNSTVQKDVLKGLLVTLCGKMSKYEAEKDLSEYANIIDKLDRPPIPIEPFGMVKISEFLGYTEGSRKTLDGRIDDMKELNKDLDRIGKN